MDGFASHLGERLFRLRHLAGVGVAIFPLVLERTQGAESCEHRLKMPSASKAIATSPIDASDQDQACNAVWRAVSRTPWQQPVASSRRDLIEP